ncbi:TetR/AcrR family transcriptional regulator [Actinokineospora sp. HUAS TT18]|uniref:TetR/AcrR family transcriptional regulator n=1 Tax=Actinokineospora sp. HUAS TT18 TaxID=3447451 RepID=UPI003F52104D
MVVTKRAYAGVAADDRRAQRRERLLLAALELFTARGYQQTKIVDLCTLAGVSTRNFYEEFQAKEQLLLTLHGHINAQAMRHVTAKLTTIADADAETRVATLVDTFITSVTADPRLPRLNYVEAVGVSADLERQHQHWVRKWADFIESEARHAADKGEAPDRDYRLTAFAMVGAITGLLREWQAHDPPLAAAEIATEIRALMLSAITRPA